MPFDLQVFNKQTYAAMTETVAQDIEKFNEASQVLGLSYFKSMLKNKSLKPFKYNDKGSMAIIGKNKAVVDLPNPKLHFNGLFAWLIWLFVHLMSLISYRNRIMTFFNWMTAYFSKDQSLRMIIRPDKKSKKDVS